ncbi:ALDH-like protein [Thozetella sp. PMI_491]|nr:ALDH-like protein [Thozetella sp. PMI_491]
MGSQGEALERLLAAVVDGKTENTRYRQDQLQNLHRALREAASALTTALVADTKASALEVETEFYLGMDAVRHFYETIDFKKELQDEYLVAHGKNNESRLVGAGLVIIRPTSHSRFYSVVSALAAAISAGNAVILELQETLLQTDSVLRATLSSALDVNTFYISKNVTDSSILERAVLVDQTGAIPSGTRVLSSSRARAVAVVDRSADLEAAAKAITTARFSFGGTSPFAPDLVLVNEFVKKDFFEACSRYATLAFARESTVKKVSANQSENTKRAVSEAEAKRQVSSFGSDDFKLVDVLDKNTALLGQKITGRYLPIVATSGLVDAIFNQQFESPLLASYVFAEARAAKYIAQHLPAQISVVNQIPVQLLVGPAAPSDQAPDFLYRYTKEMFSVTRPQFIEPLPEALQKAEQLLSGTSKGMTSSSLRALAVKPLAPTGQPKNQQIGFFESGFFYGASISLPVILSLLGYTSYVLGRKGWELALKLRGA